MSNRGGLKYEKPTNENTSTSSRGGSKITNYIFALKLMSKHRERGRRKNDLKFMNEIFCCEREDRMEFGCMGGLSTL